MRLKPHKAPKFEAEAKSAPDNPLSGMGKDYTRDEYNEVARAANIVGVSLLSEEFKVESDYYDVDEAENDQLGFGISSTAYVYDPDISLASGYWEWHATVKRGRRHIVKIKANYLAAYEMPKGCNHFAAKAFIARVGKFTTYPYFRARVGGISSDAQLQLPILPVIAS